MIAVDGSPFVFGPRSVAQALRALLTGWERVDASEPLELFTPPEGTSPRRFRAQLSRQLAAADVAGFLSPWSAFPDLAAVGIPVVAMIHELPFVQHGALEGRVRAWRHRRWLRRNVARCAGLVVPTESTRADVLTLHPAAADRVHVVPNGFDPAPWEAARRVADTPPYAVMVGIGGNRPAARKKGLDVALEAWRRRLVPDDLRLVLVGKPALPLPARVDARPDLAPATLRDLVAGAALLLYPSRSEGFGYPPLEGLAAGVPVIASDIPAVREVAGDAVVYVPAGAPEALARAVSAVCAAETRRRSDTPHALERVHAFASERAAAGLRAVFRGVGIPA